MREFQILGLAWLTVTGGQAAAQEAVETAPLQVAAARAAPAPAVSTTWEARPLESGIDRLQYLDAPRCGPHAGCGAAALGTQSLDIVLERDLIDSLDLGSYGPVEFKFTGDRVKVQVKF